MSVYLPMGSFMKADIFFFVTTISVALVTIGLIVTFIYIIRAVKKLEEIKEVAEDVRESWIWNLLFKKKKRK